MRTQGIVIESLNPVQLMELADALYDLAMHAFELNTPTLSAEQATEIDRRLARLHAGESTTVSGEVAYERLLRNR